jgi:tetratricopeptide (TPR) repeat protein
LTTDGVRIDLRTDAGHEFGIALFVMLVLVLLAGLAIEFAVARKPPGDQLRRRAGIAIVVVLALVPVVFTGSLIRSDRGLTGSVSHSWTTLTDPNAVTPSNDPGRLTEVGSVRSRYWNEALQIFGDHPWTGVGAGGYATARPLYRKDAYAVRHAHGYVVQTLADLGIFGLLGSLALAVAWFLAAGKSTGLLRRLPWEPPAPRRPITPERVGLLTLATMALIFGIHSSIDWTWFIPGTAVPALLAAGWVAGRGPGEQQNASMQILWLRIRSNAREPLRAGAATLLILLTLAAMWATWQPWRSNTASNSSLAALTNALEHKSSLRPARDLAIKAHNENPLSAEPLLDLAAVYAAAGNRARARATFRQAIRLQPANATIYFRYADFELNDADDPDKALRLVRLGAFLDPHSRQAGSLLFEIANATGTTFTPNDAGSGSSAPAPGS